MGLLIALVSYLLEPLSSFILRKYGHHRHQHLEWTSNSTLQLQRLAHESLGLGTWSKCTGNIPITEAHELLGCLDTTDRQHPIISISPKPANETSEARTLTVSREIAAMYNLASAESSVSLSLSVDEPSSQAVGSPVVADTPKHAEVMSIVALPEAIVTANPLRGDDNSSAMHKS